MSPKSYKSGVLGDHRFLAQLIILIHNSSHELQANALRSFAKNFNNCLSTRKCNTAITRLQTAWRQKDLNFKAAASVSKLTLWRTHRWEHERHTSRVEPDVKSRRSCRRNGAAGRSRRGAGGPRSLKTNCTVSFTSSWLQIRLFTMAANFNTSFPN